MDGFAIALTCLAINVYFEASGEPPEGLAAVAHVTLNRAKADDKEVCAVIGENLQFSWANGDGIIRTPDGWHLSPRTAAKINRNSLAWKEALAISEAAFYTSDLTNGATHYHEAKVSPGWAKQPGMKFIRRIGNHLFYRYTKPTKEQ